MQTKLGFYDSDVAPTKTTISLLCPLSQMRMANPCRSSQCQHTACFDALFFLKVRLASLHTRPCTACR